MSQGQVYLVGVLEGCYKIGRSVDAKKRLLELSYSLPVALKLHHRIITDDAAWLEGVLHSVFAVKRKRGEWFKLSRQEVACIKRLREVNYGPFPPELVSLTGLSESPDAFCNMRPNGTRRVKDQVLRSVVVQKADPDGLLEVGETITVTTGSNLGHGDVVLVKEGGALLVRCVVGQYRKSALMLCRPGETDGVRVPLRDPESAGVVGVLSSDRRWERFEK